ncbi:hypothetical protein FCV25MIE_18301 [Fagus crenata]
MKWCQLESPTNAARLNRHHRRQITVLPSPRGVGAKVGKVRGGDKGPKEERLESVARDLRDTRGRCVGL